ncbi:metalloprotease TIKI1-like [Stegodyphus dumicola]|nr:metalloprotease TIKI1-like [Stegodyphus dumicola]
MDGDPFSFLWTIKRDPPSYLFGTIHVPYTKVWEYIPDNAKQAFASSSHVYFELDLVNPTTVSALSTCQMLPQGKNLSDVLPGDLYSRLKKHLEYVRGMMPHWMTADQRGRGLYADYLFNAIAGNWERKRPVWVMLMVNSLTESDVRSRGVPVLDLYLAQEAERLHKQTAAVEKVEEQCLPLNGLNFSQLFLLATLPEVLDDDGTNGVELLMANKEKKYKVAEQENTRLLKWQLLFPFQLKQFSETFPSSIC